MQSTSCKMSGWMKYKLESRLMGKISVTSDMWLTPPLWQKVKRNCAVIHGVAKSQTRLNDWTELKHTRPPCPSPTPRACSNSCPFSWCCHPAISSSVDPFSSCLQSFPASGSFQMSQFFASGGQSTRASVSVLPMNSHDLFPLGLTVPIMYLRRKWQPTPVFLPGESHGWRSLVGYSPWGR